MIGLAEVRRLKDPRNQLRRTLVTSGPLSLGIGVAGCVVGCVSLIVLLTSDRAALDPIFVWLYAVVATLGGGLSLFLGIYGFRLTREVERDR